MRQNRNITRKFGLNFILDREIIKQVNQTFFGTRKYSVCTMQLCTLPFQSSRKYSVHVTFPKFQKVQCVRYFSKVPESTVYVRYLSKVPERYTVYVRYLSKVPESTVYVVRYLSKVPERLFDTELDSRNKKKFFFFFKLCKKGIEPLP